MVLCNDAQAEVMSEAEKTDISTTRITFMTLKNFANEFLVCFEQNQ